MVVIAVVVSYFFYNVSDRQKKSYSCQQHYRHTKKIGQNSFADSDAVYVECNSLMLYFLHRMPQPKLSVAGFAFKQNCLLAS